MQVQVEFVQTVWIRECNMYSVKAPSLQTVLRVTAVFALNKKPKPNGAFTSQPYENLVTVLGCQSVFLRLH